MRLPEQYGKILYNLTADVLERDLDLALRQYILFLQREQALSKIDYIINAFERYAKEKSGIEIVTAESARPLLPQEVKKIRSIVGAKAEIKNNLNAALMGGLVLKNRDRILDGSLRGQLDRLARALTAE